MYYSLRGIIINIQPSFFVIECNGVGYKCLATMNTLQEIPRVGQEATVLTHLNVREDAMELFGFATNTELSCFKLLTSVSGVGSKVGLAILSGLSADQVAVSIATNDSKTLTLAQGVGPKLAQRIVLELKDKIKGFEYSNEEYSNKGAENVVQNNTNIEKATEALVGLGFNSADIAPILAKLDQTLTVEQLIAETLREKGKR